jgi:hypothetical protein
VRTHELGPKAVPKSSLAQAQVMVNQAQDILDTVSKDGFWGVHAPAFTQQKVREARLLAEGALSLTSSRTESAK